MPAADSKKRDANGIATGEWESGLFSCFHHCVPNCLTTWLFPFLSLAQIEARVGGMTFAKAFNLYFALYVCTLSCSMIGAFYYSHQELRLQLDTTTTTTSASGKVTGTYKNSQAVSPFTLAIILECVATVSTLVTVFFIFVARNEIRVRYEIPGSDCGDLCVTCWCSCCSIAQMASHVKSYKSGSCSVGQAVDTLPAHK